jgi:hypothetical protein
LKAKTSYRRRRIELIVERLEAERKKLDIRIEAEPEAEQREVESSIEVVAKVGHMRLYSEVAEKVGQADPYASNLLAFLEDSEVEAMAERIEVTGKLDTMISVTRKLDLENSEVLDLENSEVLDLENSEVLDLENSEVLDLEAEALEVR